MNKIKPNALTLLMFKYQSPVITLEQVISDFFTHLNLAEANRRANKMSLPFPVFKAENSKKAPFLVSIEALAQYLDKQAEVANQDYQAMTK